MVVPLVLLLTVTGIRRLARTQIEKRRASLVAVLEAMADLGAKHTSKPKGRRIASPDDRGADARAEETEADVGEEAARSRVDS